MADKQTNKDRLREITAGIEDGIKELFQSDRYMQYLRTMSRFHKYSVNNTILIYMQKPDATQVAGFNKWRDQFSRHVKRGEKGIQIIAPTPFKKKIEAQKLDPETRAPILNPDGTIATEERVVQVPMYKPVFVFDVSQTEGKPLPELAANLTGDVQNYEIFMEALRRASPVPISLEAMKGMDGYFSPDDQRIAIQEGMSEVQTVSAVIHEIAHAKLHNYEQAREQAAAGDENAQPIAPKSRETEEIEAESISYAVCAYYGIETGENSFGYLASWSKDKELTALRQSLEAINKAASGLITDVDHHFQEIMKERGLDKTEPERAAPELPEVDHSYKLHANPRSIGDADAAFIQVYEHRNGEVFPGEVMGFGAYADFIPLTNRLNEEKIQPEDARLMVDEYANKPTHDNGKEAVSVEQTTERTFPMPDPALSIEDMHNYGYLDGDMLPVTKERALELMEQDVTIYGLEQGVRSVRLTDGWEINNYDGMLGVFTDTWEETSELLPPSVLQQSNERLYIADDQRYLHLQLSDAGTWDYTFYDRNTLKSIDGGMLDAPAMTLAEARDAILLEHDMAPESIFYLSPRQTQEMLDSISKAGLEEIAQAAHPGKSPRDDGKRIEGDDSPALRLDCPSGYPLPDPALTVAELEKCGYLDGDLFPISKDRAHELMERDLTVYMVQSGENPEMAFEPEDLDAHGGIFAVARSEWETSPEFREAVADRLNRQQERETAFLQCPVDAFAIYQLRHGDERLHYIRFESLEQLRAREEALYKNDYDLIYTSPLTQEGGSDKKLETLFERFNIDRPPDFGGHSLSVSDIVVLKQDGVVTSHYCDSAGFQELPGFFSGKNMLRAAEDSIEQNDNQLDGIINNTPGPTVAELEAQVKAGQQISLMDLAGAVHRERREARQEKRPSVLEQLKSQPKQEAKKSAPKKSAEREI